MNSEEQILPIIPDGKYKGKDVTHMMQDKKYLEWFKKQQWFNENNKKWKPIYNIVINQNISTSNNSKTPEHNKLQNLFLKKNNQKKLFHNIFKNVKINLNKYEDDVKKMINNEEFKKKFNILEEPNENEYFKTKIEFEGKFNWDLIMENTVIRKKFKFKSKFNIDNYIIIDGWGDIKTIHGFGNLFSENFINKNNVKFDFDKNIFYSTNKETSYTVELNGYNHIIVDTSDYIHTSNGFNDSIIKNGLEFNPNKNIFNYNYSNYYDSSDNNRIYCELKPTLSDEYPDVLRKIKKQITLTETSKVFVSSRKNIYILLIGSFNSRYTSKEELIEIFNQTGIKIVFMDEIFEPTKNLIITNEQQKEEKIKDLKEKINNLEKQLNELEK